MDSWSRPSKSQATPAPYYLLPGGEDTPYCHSCGRVISSRRNGNNNNPAAVAAQTAKDKDKEVVKYCSSRCRSHKPGKLDRDMEGVFVEFLSGGVQMPAAVGGGGAKPHKGKKKAAAGKKAKGDARVLVSCDAVERHVFPPQDGGDGEDVGTEDGATDDEGSYTTTDAETSPPQPPPPPPASDIQNTAVMMMGSQPPPAPPDSILLGPMLANPTSDAPAELDYDRVARLSIRSGTRIRPPQEVSEVNGSVGGEKGRAERGEETEGMLERRREGMRRVRQREMVRCAARRGVVFGFVVAGDGEGEGERRKCEAVMLGKVVEPSFAKGGWGVRWRE